MRRAAMLYISKTVNDKSRGGPPVAAYSNCNNDMRTQPLAHGVAVIPRHAGYRDAGCGSDRRPGQ